MLVFFVNFSPGEGGGEGEFSTRRIINSSPPWNRLVSRSHVSPRRPAECGFMKENRVIHARVLLLDTPCLILKDRAEEGRWSISSSVPNRPVDRGKWKCGYEKNGELVVRSKIETKLRNYRVARFNLTLFDCHLDAYNLVCSSKKRNLVYFVLILKLVSRWSWISYLRWFLYKPKKLEWFINEPVIDALHDSFSRSFQYARIYDKSLRTAKT